MGMAEHELSLSQEKCINMDIQTKEGIGNIIDYFRVLGGSRALRTGGMRISMGTDPWMELFNHLEGERIWKMYQLKYSAAELSRGRIRELNGSSSVAGRRHRSAQRRAYHSVTIAIGCVSGGGGSRHASPHDLQECGNISILITLIGCQRP